MPSASVEAAFTPGPAELRPLRIARRLALVASALGVCALMGWTFYLPALTTVLPGLVSMKVNTAICLVCGGLSLFLLARPGADRHQQQVASGLAVVMAFLGALTLLEYFTGWHLGIDEALFKDPTASGAPGRMAPLTATNAVAVGIALRCLATPARVMVAHALAMVVCSTSILAITGYVYGVHSLYQAGSFTAVALHTSVAFLSLGVGICCARSQHGFMRILTNAQTSGMLVRRCLPAVALPFVIAWLRVLGVERGWFSVEAGVVIVALANAAGFVALILIGAFSVHTAERRQTTAQQSLRESEEKYRSLFTSIDTGFCVIEMIWDEQGHPVDYRFLEVNPAFEGHTGLRGSVGRTIREMQPDIEQVWMDRYARVARSGEAARFIEGSDVLGRWFDVFAFASGEAGNRHVAILFSDISERRRTELVLQTAKTEAEAASRAKDDFLAALSHELRTPLTPVLMAASDLCDDPVLPANVRDTLRMMQRNIGLEARLIDDLLDLTRIANGKLTLRAQDCEAHSLVGLALEIVRDEAQAKGIVLGVDLSAMRTHFVGDPSRVQQVFWNLLKNAIKFTPAGGQVSVSSFDAGEQLVVEVSDTGHGLAPEHLESIFRPFEQAGLTNNARFGGLGLGLAIAKAIVEMHGGMIRAKSAGTGQGATFRVELSAIERPLGIAKAVLPKAPANPSEPSVPSKASEPLRLLLVEDHEATLQVLTRLLSRVGYLITTASSVAAAREVATHTRFDLVISDVGLPDGTGIELMEVLHSGYGLRGIALTGYGMEEDQRRTREVGFVEHLVKPVDFAQLRRAIERAVPVRMGVNDEG